MKVTNARQTHLVPREQHRQQNFPPLSFISQSASQRISPWRKNILPRSPLALALYSTSYPGILAHLIPSSHGIDKNTSETCHSPSADGWNHPPLQDITATGWMKMNIRSSNRMARPRAVSVREPSVFCPAADRPEHEVTWARLQTSLPLASGVGCKFLPKWCPKSGLY